ncbi:MAG: hypothetical protein PVH87_04700 [Desulfobacteraceae bacterium]
MCVTFHNLGPPGGDTTVTVVSCANPPDGIILNQSDPTCVGIQTSAPFDLAWMCVPYDDTVCADPNPNQHLLCELQTFVIFRCDIGTCTRIRKNQDTDANTVCGLTDQFSLFLVGIVLFQLSPGVESAPCAVCGRP